MHIPLITGTIPFDEEKRPRFVVMIHNKNQFFVLGIKALLKAVFTDSGWSLHVATSTPHEPVDLMIYEESAAWLQMGCHHVLTLLRDTHTTIIAVRDVRRRYRTQRMPCQERPNIIFYQDPPHQVMALLESVLEHRKARPLMHKAHCTACCLALTPREKAVLQLMACGHRSVQLATLLNISEKTISAHKRAAMRKLGFRRSQELYHWLRLGGLNVEADTKALS